MGCVARLDVSVLLADDEDTMLRSISRLLTGWKTMATTDPVRALGWLGIQTFDAIVADLIMPRMDGIELCRRARRAGFQGVNVLYSGYVTDRVRARALRAGVHAVLSKGSDARALRAQVRTLIELRQKQPQGTSQQRTLDPAARLARAFDLSKHEEQLLSEIALGARRADELIERVWGRAGNRHVFDVTLGRLRNKIDGSGWSIPTPAHGAGYLLLAPAERSAAR